MEEKNKKQRVLCVGDIHGNYKALMQCLERCGFDYEKDTLISLGDVIDGHCDNFEVVEELLKIKNLIAIKGNHDDWFNEWLITRENPSNWQQGQLATGISYLKNAGKKYTGKFFIPDIDNGGLVAKLKVSDIPESHIKFFKNQVPYYLDDNNNLFVHGGFEPNIPLDEQGMNLWWDRDLWKKALEIEQNNQWKVKKESINMIQEFNEIFIGHTSTQFVGVEVPIKALNIINLDQGAGGKGKLSIMDINSKEYWQSDKALELYPDFKGR